MPFKDKIRSIWSVIDKHFLMFFCLSIFAILISFSIFGLKLNLLSHSVIIYAGLIFGFMAFFFRFIRLPEQSPTRKIILEFLSPFFLMSLIILTLSNLDFLMSRLALHFVKDLNPALTLVAIFSGVIIFYANRDRVEKEIKEEKNNEKLTEQKRAEEFPKKFPMVNRVPVMNNIVQRMYIYGWLPSILLVMITIVFIGIKIGIPLIYTGSYIDETIHLFSGIEFFKSGHFAELYQGLFYNRGMYVSIMVGIFLKLFGQTIFVAKMVPAFIGIINFFLLLKISRKIFSKKVYVLLLMTIYTLIPWLIFNHFYIRMYVFYECFILIQTLLFIKINEDIKNVRRTLLYFSVFFIVLLVNYTFSNDVGKYMAMVYSAIFLVYIYFFQIQKIPLKNRLLRSFCSKKSLKIIIFCIASLPVLYYVYSFALIQNLINGTVVYTSGVGFKYYDLFFRLNTTFTIFFLCSSVFIFFERIKTSTKFVILSVLTLFIIHMISSPDLQMTRVITYFLPVFYLISLFSVSYAHSVFMNKFFIFIIMSSLVLNVYSNYPTNFLNGPYVPTEVNYEDYYRASKYVNTINIDDETLISSQPHINIFLNTKYSSIYLLRDNKESNYDKTVEYYDTVTNTIRSVLTNTVVISDYNQFSDIINKSNRHVILYLNDDLFGWITPESKQIIKDRFTILKTFQGITIYSLYQ